MISTISGVTSIDGIRQWPAQTSCEFCCKNKPKLKKKRRDNNTKYERTHENFVKNTIEDLPGNSVDPFWIKIVSNKENHAACELIHMIQKMY